MQSFINALVPLTKGWRHLCGGPALVASPLSGREMLLSRGYGTIQSPIHDTVST